MKLGIYGYDLSIAANKVAKAIATKSTNPILECIKIATSGDYAVFTATDLDIGIEVRVKCEVFEEGETVVVGKTFVEFANKLSELDYVELESNGKQVKVCCGKVKIALSTMDCNKFPKVLIGQDENSFVISSKELKSIVGATTFACATDEARPILKGCLFEVNGNTLNVCSLDGFRLALKTCCIENTKNNVKSIIPARSLLELLRLIEDEEYIKLLFSNNTLSIKTKETIFTARLLNGDFVNYKALLSTPKHYTVKVNKEKLIYSLDRLSILAKLSNNVVRCTLENGSLALTTNNDLGNAEDIIDVDYNDKKIELCFNYKYIVDCLKVIEDEFVNICFGKDSNSPFFVCPIDNGDYEYMILPMRISA